MPLRLIANLLRFGTAQVEVQRDPTTNHTQPYCNSYTRWDSLRHFAPVSDGSVESRPHTLCLIRQLSNIDRFCPRDLSTRDSRRRTQITKLRVGDEI